ncbi:MAG: response regulator transcription factor [Chloroflexota bacterium]
MQVLIVEDDSRLADVLKRGLVEEGYGVVHCTDGNEALLQAAVAEYDAIVLDVMLPGTSGLDVCRQLRASEVTTPILMLTARDSVDDVVAGLEAGADDYVTKPFAFRELRARLQSVMRRAAGATSSQLQTGDIVLDIASREVRCGGERIVLTNREYQVLEYLMHNRGRVLTRSMIEEHVWGYDYGGLSNTVDVHIKRLRRKIDRPGAPSSIETIRGAGYRLVDIPI